MYEKIKIYTTWKAGSTFTRKFFNYAAELKYMQIVKLTSAQGKFVPLKSHKEKNPQKIELESNLPNTNYCAIVYRYFPLKNSLNNSNIIHILQIRDPRDVLVSLYFSLAYIHPYANNTSVVRNKMKKTNIDKFVIDNSIYFEEIYNDLSLTINYKNVQYLNYNEMITNFESWSKKATQHFDLNTNQQNLIYNNFKHEFENIKETTEQELASGKIKHTRKMLPGDYKEKLNPNTIKILNDKFKNSLNFIDKIF